MCKIEIIIIITLEAIIIKFLTIIWYNEKNDLIRVTRPTVY